MSIIGALDPRFVASGLFGGFAIGLTGMGGGAILTPLLLALGVSPAAAIGSDLVASLVMKPVAGSVHAKARTVRWDLVRWLSVGSVPSAFAGVAASRWLTRNGDSGLRRAIGFTLLMASAAIIIRAVRARRSPTPTEAGTTRPTIRPIPTVLLGVAGGFLVGLTSVGSGSLMVVALTMLYPTLSSSELVGTDLVQAIPLVAAGVGAAATTTARGSRRRLVNRGSFAAPSIGSPTTTVAGAGQGAIAGFGVRSARNRPQCFSTSSGWGPPFQFSSNASK